MNTGIKGRLLHAFGLRPSMRAVRQIAGTFGANVTILLFGLAGGVIMARALGPEGRGQLAAVLVVAGTLNWLFNAGLGWGNLYYLNKMPHATAVILTNSLVYSLLLAIPITLLSVLTAHLLFAQYPSDVRDAATVFLALLPVSIAADYLIFAQQALQQFRLSNGLRVARQAIQFLIVAALILTDRLTVVTAIASVATANMAIAVWSFGWYRQRYWRQAAFDRMIFTKCFRFGLKAFWGSLAQTGNRRLDQMVMVVLISPTQLGLYTVAASLSEGVVIVPNSIASVISPRVANRDENAARSLLVRSARLSAIIVAGVVVVLVLTAQYVLQLFYGPDFVAATGVLQILLVAAWFLGMGDLLGQGMNGLGHPTHVSLSETVALIVSIVLLLILTPLYGIIGAAMASLVAYLLRFAVLTIMLARTNPHILGST